MKTLGLIGGTTWHSTVDYYRAINQSVNARLGGLHSAKLILYSVDFDEMQPPEDEAGWTRIGGKFQEIAHTLERAGAEALVLCANTPHLLAEVITRGLRIPLIHIAEATARAIAGHKLDKVGLLGTKFTMERPFYKERLARAGIEAIVPDEAERAFVHRSIFEELGHGVLRDETKRKYLELLRTLEGRGAQGVVLGCTEIPMLIKPGDSKLPLFDTTAIHAEAAVEFALG